MKTKIQKTSIEAFFVFALSPFLSLPLILVQLKRNDKNAIKLFALLFGFLSLLYIPSWTNDKARYYERYSEFKNFDFNLFLENLIITKRPDFIFEGLLFFFAKLNVKIEFLFFVVTALTVFLIFKFISKMIEYLTCKIFNYSGGVFLLVIFTFSLSGLFSGIRFYLATSFFVWAVYYFLFSYKKTKGILFILLTLFTHFSFAFLLPLFFFHKIFPKHLNPKIILFFSLFFMFLPKDVLGSFMGFLSVPENYAIKADAYIGEEREISDNSILLTFIRNSWLYFSYFYLLLIAKLKNNKFSTLLTLSISLINITFSIPLVFNRYTIFLKILAIIFYISQYKRDDLNKTSFLLISFLFLCNFIVDVTVLRYNFLASYNLSDMFTIIQLVSRKISPNEFL